MAGTRKTMARSDATYRAIWLCYLAARPERRSWWVGLAMQGLDAAEAADFRMKLALEADPDTGCMAGRV